MSFETPKLVNLSTFLSRLRVKPLGDRMEALDSKQNLSYLAQFSKFSIGDFCSRLGTNDMQCLRINYNCNNQRERKKESSK